MRIFFTVVKQIALVAATSVAVTGVAHAAPVSYAIDPAHTFVTFEIGHFGASVNRGRFEKKKGHVELDKATKTGKVDITFHIDSLTTGTAEFDKHLQSADVFDAAQYPTARFVSDTFNFEGDKVVSVSGTLTLKGKSHPVTFKAQQFACYDSPILNREVCGGDFEATIDRTLFGVDYGIQYGFPKNVRLVAQIESIKQ